jgi:hypothetical protein
MEEYLPALRFIIRQRITVICQRIVYLGPGNMPFEQLPQVSAVALRMER